MEDWSLGPPPNTPSLSKPVAEALIWAGGVKGEENGSHFGRGRSTQLIIYLESLIGLRWQTDAELCMHLQRFSCLILLIRYGFFSTILLWTTGETFCEKRLCVCVCVCMLCVV